jgi:hypothetical protein
MTAFQYADHKTVVEVGPNYDRYYLCKDCGRTFDKDDTAPPRCRKIKPRIGNHESFEPVYPSVLDILRWAGWRLLLVSAALAVGIVIGLKLRGY